MVLQNDHAGYPWYSTSLGDFKQLLMLYLDWNLMGGGDYLIEFHSETCLISVLLITQSVYSTLKCPVGILMGVNGS